MKFGVRILAVLLAVIFPPAGIFLLSGRRLALIISSVLFLIAMVVFWGAFALPGVALWGLAIIHALMMVIIFGPAKVSKQDR